MKVLIGPNNVANQAYYVAKYLRAYGVDATCVVYRAANRFNYDADWVVRLDPEHLRATGQRPSDVYRNTLGEAFERGFDIFHFYQSSLIPGGLPITHNLLKGMDIPLIRQRGARVIYRFTGWEIRNRELDLERNPYSPFRHGCIGCPDPDRRDHYVNFLKQHVDAFVVTDPQMHENIPEAHVIPRILNLADFPEVGVERSRRPLVVHAPSNRSAKGSEYVLKALEECRNRGAEFDLELIENMPFNEAVECYKRADLVIDQVLIGWHGVLTLECLAMGKPVAVFIREDLLRGSPYADIPVVNINLDNIVDQLLQAITDAEFRISLSTKARAYMARHHDVPAVIPKMISLYKSVEAAPVKPSGTDDFAYVLSYRDELRRIQAELKDAKETSNRSAVKAIANRAKKSVPTAVKSVPITVPGIANVVAGLGSIARRLVNLKVEESRPVYKTADAKKFAGRLANLQQANEGLRKANASLRTLHAGWVTFMSTSAMFAEGAGVALRQQNFAPQVAIGHDVTTLEALRTIGREFKSSLMLDAVEFTEVAQRTGPVFRTYPPEGLEILQSRIDQLVTEMDEVLSVGPAIADALAQRHNRAVTVVANAREAAQYYRTPLVREKIAAADHDVVCAFPNLIAEGYGFETVVEAFRELPERFKLVHIGRVAALGGFKGIVESYKTDPKLKGRFFSLGELPYAQVPTYLSGADLGIISLIPSSENVRLAFPNRFHDLVAAGLPILTSRIQDIQKAVTENRLGVVLAGSDSKSIAEGIVECAANRESYRENVLRYREQNVWQNEVAKLLASIDATAQRICVVVKKDVTNHGRTHRMVASLLAAGKDVRVVAPAGNLPIAHPKLGVILVRDGLLNKG